MKGACSTLPEARGAGEARFVSRLEPRQFGGASMILVPYEPRIGGGATTGDLCALHVKCDPFAEHPHARRRGSMENRVSSVGAFQEGKTQQQGRLPRRIRHARANKPFGTMERRVRNDVGAFPIGGQEVSPSLAIT